VQACEHNLKNWFNLRSVNLTQSPMDVKTITPREDLNIELNNMDDEQIKELLEFARKLVTLRKDRINHAENQTPESGLAPTPIETQAVDLQSRMLVANYEHCPLWNSPEEDAAWGHL
jgi:hypothetical protein